MGIIGAMAAFAAWLGTGVFVVRYWPKPWRTRAWGRHLMHYAIVTWGLLTLAVLYRTIGDYPFRAEIGAAALIAYAVVIWRRVWLNERDTRDDKRARALNRELIEQEERDHESW